MAYNIKTTHHELINNVSTEIKTDATVYEMNEVKDSARPDAATFQQFKLLIDDCVKNKTGFKWY